jgi:hypothetical protein
VSSEPIDLVGGAIGDQQVEIRLPGDGCKGTEVFSSFDLSGDRPAVQRP